MSSAIPVIDDVSLQELVADPYPVYERLRRAAPVVHVAAANINFVTRFDDIMFAERNTQVFASSDNSSLMSRVMGHTLMRRDGDDHKCERMALEPSFRPGVVNTHWRPTFQRIATELVEKQREKGQADLFDDFAAPMASRCLMEVLGLPDIDWRDLCVWSQTMMDAVGNYGNDPEIWRKSEASTRAIDAALDRRIPLLKGKPDPSVLSSLVNAAEPISIDRIRANVKVIIGGGLNEPRDAICTAAFGLLSNPDQLSMVRNDDALWGRVFEEAVRWIAPIGLYPRRLTEDAILGGQKLPAGTRLGLSIASACRDENHFGDAGRFDIRRPKKAHLAFGAGPHFCLGTWIARMQVGQIAVPTLIRTLPELRLDRDRLATFGGWVFRGALSMPVKWN